MESVQLLEQPAVQVVTECVECLAVSDACKLHKRCRECGVVKGRVIDFGARYNFCDNHRGIEDKVARTLKAESCEQCQETRKSFYRQPRCHECDRKRGARRSLLRKVRHELTAAGRDQSAIEVSDSAKPSLKIRELLPPAISSMIGTAARALGFCMDSAGGALAAAVARGDADSAEELLRRCEPVIRRAARTKNPDDYEDLLQEARIAVYRRVAEGKYDPSKSAIETFAHWKSRGAVSTARRKLRDAQGTQSYSQLKRQQNDGSPAGDGVDSLFGRIRDTFNSSRQDNFEALELREVIDRAFALLDPTDATVLKLRVIEHRTVREIEASSRRREFNLPPMSRSAVLGRQNRALSIVRSALIKEL